MNEKTYDPACYDLAEHFLTNEPDLAFRTAELAGHIQQAVELWIEYERAHGQVRDRAT